MKPNLQQLTGQATEAQIKAQVEAMAPLGMAIAENRAQIFNQIVTTVLTKDQLGVLQNFKGPQTQ